jgi:hypothetical protein
MDVLAKTANEKLREQESQRNIMDIAKRLDPPIGVRNLLSLCFPLAKFYPRI